MWQLERAATSISSGSTAASTAHLPTTCGEADAGTAVPPSKLIVCARLKRPLRNSSPLSFAAHLISAVWDAIVSHRRLQDLDISKLGVAAGVANAAIKCALASDGSVTRESRQRPQLTPSGFVGLLPKAARRIDRAAGAGSKVSGAIAERRHAGAANDGGCAPTQRHG